MPDKQRLSVALLSAFAAFAIASFAPQIFNDGDTYLHIAAGMRMLSDHAILFHDPFSYTFMGKPWDAHEWLSEIVMALVYVASGWAGVTLLFAAAFGLASGLLAFHLSQWLSTAATLIILVLALSCMSGSLLARPHLLALPMLELWTAGLIFARSQHRAPSWLLLPVMTLWANLHGGFVFGFMLLAFLGTEALIEDRGSLRTLKSWAFFFSGAVLAAMLTPHFVDGLIFPFHLIAMTQLANIGEWRPANFATLQPFELVLLAAIYVFLSRGVKLPIMRLLMLLLLLHLSLQHVRHQVLFAIVVPLLLAESLADALNARPEAGLRATHPAWNVAAVALAIGVCAARLAWPASHGGDLVTPQAALMHVPGSVISKPVFNDYSFGGYLIFKGIPVFIDSRAELYGESFLQNYSRIIRPDPTAMKATLKKYGIGWTILSPESPAVAVLDLLPGWRRVYTDRVAVIHVHGPNH